MALPQVRLQLSTLLFFFSGGGGGSC